MEMAKSTYYYEISKADVVSEKNAELLAEIKKIFEQNRHRYGVRRVHQELINREDIRLITNEFKELCTNQVY